MRSSHTWFPQLTRLQAVTGNLLLFPIASRESCANKRYRKVLMDHSIKRLYKGGMASGILIWQWFVLREVVALNSGHQTRQAEKGQERSELSKLKQPCKGWMSVLRRIIL